MANPDTPPTGKLQTPMVPPWSDTFGRYTLRRLVFESPRARIWHANDTKSAREVRLKVIKPGQDVDSAAMTRWVHEANHASHIAHVAIVPLLEAGVQDGQPFLVSGWVAGQTLADLLRGTAPVPARKATARMIELLDALVLAHAAGLVHGRLQPGNILIDTQNRARLLDFALPTRVVEAQAHAAHLRQMAAWWPVSYSPNGPTRADSDIHAVGMVLARLLSGVVRPDTEGAEDAEAHVLGVAMGPDADDTCVPSCMGQWRPIRRSAMRAPMFSSPNWCSGPGTLFPRRRQRPRPLRSRTMARSNGYCAACRTTRTFRP